ncbi:Fc.00g067410.m01.CDS01 [Cosmosporella sp. VM-42]
MFTGIVEEMGVISILKTDAETGSAEMTITLAEGSSLLEDCTLGDSIAVNGVCLTATSFTSKEFTVGVAPETLRITNLGELREQNRVNLERAVRADTRMGGHFVQGHVDTTAEILFVTQDGNALTYRFQPKNREMLTYIVYKGFIALDGTSLTVTQVNDAEGWFEVMLIIYTQSRVVIADKKAGDSVNIEVDMMAKYAQKSLAGILGGQSENSIPLLEKMVERIVAQKLGEKQ